MLCCICNEREAKVHLIHIDGEQKHKFDLCDKCAVENGVNDRDGFSVTDLIEMSQEQQTAG